jgi:hypothetical protein
MLPAHLVIQFGVLQEVLAFLIITRRLVIVVTIRSSVIF